VSRSQLSLLGLVVHPARDVAEPRQAVLDWARDRGVEVDELPLSGDLVGGDPTACDLVVAIGGDGTTLSAIRRASICQRPVLGVTCGSLGALTTVAAPDVGQALERFAQGDWTPQAIAALAAQTDDGRTIRAFNDIALVREGGGQLRIAASLDGALYSRLAGDGVIVSTAVGSSAYTLAAGGPLLDPALAAYVMTPLPTHGGFSPPLVMTAESRLEIDVSAGHAGGRLEIDGQVDGPVPERLTIGLECGAAQIVSFDDQESHLTGLRRRGIIADSPRILAEDQRG
jgi:NAD+ kinase